MNVLYDTDSGDRLIERDGIIVARVPRMVEDKWPGIANQMAQAAPLKVTVSADQASASVGYSRDGDMSWLSLKPTDRSVHKTELAIMFESPNLAEDLAETIQKAPRYMSEAELMDALKPMTPPDNQ